MTILKDHALDAYEFARILSFNVLNISAVRNIRSYVRYLYNCVVV